MSNLLNSLSSELDNPSPPPPGNPTPPIVPSTSTTASSPRRVRHTITEKNKIIAASTGAVVTSLTMTPFDVVKTRLQTQGPSAKPSKPLNSPWPPPIPSTSTSHLSASSHIHSSSLKPYFTPSSGTATLSLPTSAAVTVADSAPRHLLGFRDAVSQIVRHEGLAAMWRGTAPALAMSVPGQVIYMLGYDWGRRTAFAHPPMWAKTQPDNPTSPLSPAYLTGVPLLAGSLSRTIVAALFSPLELLRTQLQSSPSTTSILSIFHKVKAEGGFRAGWRGLPPTLWRDVPFSGVYWAGYEGIKRTLTGGKGMGEGWEEGGFWEEFGVSFVSGAGSGMLAATLTNPFDVVKTRRQAASPTSASAPTQTISLLLDIARKEGWPALMSGLTPRLAKVGPACGIMVGCYEGLGKWLD